MNLHFISSSEKRKIIQLLKEQFDIQELPFLLLQTGKEKIRAFSGHLSKDEIKKLSEIANIEIIGLYILRMEHEKQLRLSFDATQLLAQQISKNIINISDEQLSLWIRGNNLEIKTSKGVFLVRHNSDFLGCGISTGDYIINHVPKERRLRK
ncbi:MAG: hypothetical protein AABW65_01295 [Nanoarchaeota archaeon]